MPIVSNNKKNNNKSKNNNNSNNNEIEYNNELTAIKIVCQIILLNKKWFQSINTNLIKFRRKDIITFTNDILRK